VQVVPVQNPVDTTSENSSLPLAEQAYRLIKAAILRGEIEPGSRLKIETFQRQYAFSSSPLREALNRLTADDLVDIDERRGFRAAGVSMENMQDITAFRLNIEPTSLRESIELGGDDWEAEVLAAYHRLDRLEARATDERPYIDEWTERHRAFHMALIASCPSRRQLAACASLFDQVERYRRLSISWRKTRGDRANEHRAIMEAALNRDQALATDLLKAHIERTVLHVSNMLAAREPQPKASRRGAAKIPKKTTEA
jgi:GntR family carbon starvation induced transcriptional regulator